MSQGPRSLIWPVVPMFLNKMETKSVFESKKIINLSDKEPKAAAHSSLPTPFQVPDVLHSHIAVTLLHNVKAGTFIIINVKSPDWAPGTSLLHFTRPYVSAITHEHVRHSTPMLRGNVPVITDTLP